MHQDPISDLLTRIRNAALAKLTRVAIPSSKLKLEVLRILKEEGYISDYSISDKFHGVIKIYLKYNNGKSVISEIKRVSRPGRRRYEPVTNIPKTLNGYGVTIVSTSKGVMTDKSAEKHGVGGEVLCQVW